MNWILILIAVIAGAGLPVQAGINAQLGKSLGHPLLAAFFSFLVGAIALLIYAFATKVPTHNLFQVRTVPFWEWIPGVLGAFFVSATIILTPRLGAALTFGLIIAGQLLISVLLDHYGWIGLAQKSISAGRIVGVILLVAGVILIRKF